MLSIAWHWTAVSPPAQEQAFWTLVCAFDALGVEGYYTDRMVLLRADIQVLTQFMKLKCPKVAKDGSGFGVKVYWEHGYNVTSHEDASSGCFEHMAAGPYPGIVVNMVTFGGGLILAHSHMGRINTT